VRSLLSPVAPPYDPLVWDALPFPEKCRQACQAWALQGYGSPLSVVVLYALKVVFYVVGWLAFCAQSPSLGAMMDVGHWWLEPLAFQKAILWSLCFESLGFGCGSGPLTGRYLPPIGGFMYFLRPGTTKRALFPSLPLLGGHTRGWLEVALYAAMQGVLLRALLAPTVEAAHLWPLVVLLPVLGVMDQTIFLAARAEHYLTTVLCFLFAGNWIAGAKAVQLALWFWAGVSKLNHHFPSVVGVMMSNSPTMRFGWFRRRMYRSYPDDLRPSSLATWMAHAGTALELTVPVVLGLSSGGEGTLIGLALMLMLHSFITSSVPMGVPIEWNVMVVYGAFFLFFQNAGVSVFSVGAPMLVVLAFALMVIPLLGNFVPRWVSFLFAMRYYAGNWAYSVWLFKGDSRKKLERLTKSAAWPMDQLLRVYDRPTAVGLLGKVVAFRAMHLHGRVLQLVLPKAVERVEDYEWADGEIVAGTVLGWNFGEGHLHDERLLAAVQAQCGFEPGELRCVFVESQPLFGSTLSWRVHDAKDGELARGEAEVAKLRELQPFPVS
jgi:Transmembrane protein of unknown function (DUF3556)